MFQSAMPPIGACDTVTRRSRPPNCKVKQMLGEEKAYCYIMETQRYDVAPELVDAQSDS